MATYLVTRFIYRLRYTGVDDGSLNESKYTTRRGRLTRITTFLFLLIAFVQVVSARTDTSDYAHRMRAATEEVSKGNFSVTMANLEAAIL
jgi:hypothetical protein